MDMEARLQVTAKSRQSSPGRDSGHPGEAVCSPPTRHIDRGVQLCCRLLHSISCYFAMRIVFVLKP